MRRALLLGRGDVMTFVDRPLSLAFLVVCAVLILRTIPGCNLKTLRALWHPRLRGDIE